eukprot:4718238-Prymnesium_polylepis.2
MRVIARRGLRRRQRGRWLRGGRRRRPSTSSIVRQGRAGGRGGGRGAARERARIAHPLWARSRGAA